MQRCQATVYRQCLATVYIRSLDTLRNVVYRCVLGLRKAPKLKGTNIFINEDVCKATMEIRKTKLKELKEKREQGFIAYFSGADLITKERGIKQTEARRSGYSNRVNDNKQEENNSHNSDCSGTTRAFQ